MSNLIDADELRDAVCKMRIVGQYRTGGGKELDIVHLAAVLTLIDSAPRISAVPAKPAFVWPKWLKARCIFKQPSSAWWYASNAIPAKGKEGWWRVDTWVINHTFIDFTPPECDDWRDSLTLNPNWKGTT